MQVAMANVGKGMYIATASVNVMKLLYQDDQSVSVNSRVVTKCRNIGLLLQRNQIAFLLLRLLLIQSFCTVTKYHVMPTTSQDTCPRNHA